MTDKTVNIKINVNAADIDSDMKKATKAISGFTRESTGGLSKVGAAWSSFVGNVAANALSAALSSATNMFKSFISTAINGAAELEVMTVKFTTLTGSAKEADKIIQNLVKFAASTPFEMEELSSATAKLLAFGFEADIVFEKLQMLGDISSATGSSIGEIALIFGQVSAASKLTGERLLQLQERGIPILDLLAASLDKTKTQVSRMVTQGKIDFDTFDRALSSMADKGGKAFGGMINQANTYAGLQTTLTDTYKQMATSIGVELLPFMKELTKEMITFMENADIGWAAKKVREAVNGVRDFAASFGIVSFSDNFKRDLNDLEKKAKSIRLNFYLDSKQEADLEILDQKISDLKNKIRDSFGSGEMLIRPEIEGSVKIKREELDKFIGDVSGMNQTPLVIPLQLGQDQSSLEAAKAQLDELERKKIELFEAAENRRKAKVAADLKEKEEEAAMEEQDRLERQARAEQEQEENRIRADEKARMAQEARDKEMQGQTVVDKNLAKMFGGRTKWEKQEGKERVQNMQSTLGTISTLQQSNSKELQIAGKAAAIAQATIDGLRAVQIALASAPPPFNFALAGLVGAATAANVHKIASTPLGFETGGVIGGNSFTGDRNIIAANSKERVLTARQNNAFEELVYNGGNNLSNELLSELNRTLREKNFIVNIDGEKLNNELTDISKRSLK